MEVEEWLLRAILRVQQESVYRPEETVTDRERLMAKRGKGDGEGPT